LIFRKRPDNFKQKIKELKEAMKDNLFQEDLIDLEEDFKVVDLEGWE